MLASGRIPDTHRQWRRAVGDSLDIADLDLLLAVAPNRRHTADFLLAGATGPQTTIDEQLQLVAEVSSPHMAHEFGAIWQGSSLPESLQRLISGGDQSAGLLADKLRTYWSVALEPYWPAMRAVFDEDVAFRAGELTKGGIMMMLAELHPEVSIDDDGSDASRSFHPDEGDLTGTGLQLVPSIFSGPSFALVTGADVRARLIYPARGIGNLWTSADRTCHRDALAALLGRSRAMILSSLATPRSTTDLALHLGQSPPAVSQHLSVLRRSGLVVSWRSGRSVLYRQTRLGQSIAAAENQPLDKSPSR